MGWDGRERGARGLSPSHPRPRLVSVPVSSPSSSLFYPSPHPRLIPIPISSPSPSPFYPHPRPHLIPVPVPVLSPSLSPGPASPSWPRQQPGAVMEQSSGRRKNSCRGLGAPPPHERRGWRQHGAGGCRVTLNTVPSWHPWVRAPFPCGAHPAAPAVPLLQGTGLVHPPGPQGTPRQQGGVLSPGAGAAGLSPPPRDPRCPLVSPAAAAAGHAPAVGALSFSAAPFLIIAPASVPLPFHPPHSLDPPALPGCPPTVLGPPAGAGSSGGTQDLGDKGRGWAGACSAPPGSGAGLEMGCTGLEMGCTGLGWKWVGLGWNWAGPCWVVLG